MSTIMTPDIWDSRISFYQRVWSYTLIAALIVIGVVAARKIVYQNKKAFENTKSVAVYGSLLMTTDPALLFLDHKGLILKSSSDADDMFAKGENIEGRNVHDFCSDPSRAFNGTQGIINWTKKASPGDVLITFVTAKLPTGTHELAIVARAVPHIPGSDVAIVANLSYAKQTTIVDLRNVKPE